MWIVCATGVMECAMNPDYSWIIRVHGIWNKQTKEVYLMKKAIVAAVFVLILCVTQAKAAGGQVEFYAGYLNPGSMNLDSVRAGLNFSGTSLYGIRAEADFLKIFGIEQNFGFSPKLFNSTLFPNGSASDVRGFLYSTNFVLNAPLGRFVPYVTAGVGFVKPWGIDLISLDSTFAGNYGGGVKLNRLLGPMGLRIDVRGWRTADIAGTGSLNLFEASGGLTFTWGR
jgi:hypothetical protein